MIEQKIVSKRYYPELDGLRAIAILLVMWWHSSSLACDLLFDRYDFDYISVIYYKFTILGSCGVCLFFVLSGFLITGILIDTNDEKNKYKKFYIRRSLRIFPLYYGSIVLFSVLSYFYFGGYFNIGDRILAFLLYMQNYDSIFIGEVPLVSSGWYFFDHYWSLAIEEQFYIIWPIFFFWIYNKRSFTSGLMIMLALIVLSAALRFVMTYWMDWQYAYVMTLSRLDALIMGAMIAYIIKKRPKAFAEIQKRVKFFAPIFPLFIIFLGAFIAQYVELYIMYTRYLVTIGSLCSLFLFVYVLGCPKDKNIFFRVLCSGVFRRIAQVSYGMYIFHFPIQVIMRDYLIKNESLDHWDIHAVLFFVGVPLSFIVASFSFHLFEKPILRLKDKYAPIK